MKRGRSFYRSLDSGGYDARLLNSNNGVNKNKFSPVQRRAYPNVVRAAAGANYCFAIQNDGTIITWGLNGLPPVGLSNAVAIAAGFDNEIAFRSDGTVAGWGSNSYGQCMPPSGIRRHRAFNGSTDCGSSEVAKSPRQDGMLR
jgi:alpha-tubulin suppressor-like RCC1 family protein